MDVPLLKHRVAFDNAKATFEGSFDELETLPEWRLPEIAFVGRSNVGKSSMLNAIVKKSVAVSGKRPGRTRRINMFRLEDERRGDAASCVLTDLPGYGYAVLGKEEQEQIARFVRRYLDERPQLKLVVLIVDSRRDPDQTDLDVLNELKSRRRPVLLVATKIDKFDTSHALVKRLDELTEAFGQEPLYFSSVTRQGRGDLLGVVNDYLTLGDISSLPEQSGEEDEEPYFEAPYDESLSPQAAEFVLLQEDIPEFDDDDEEIKF